MKILNILSSINGTDSNSKKVVEAINSRILERYPEATLKVKDLSKTSVPHLESVHLQAFYNSEIPEEDKAKSEFSDNAISEILEADILVIAVPLYNFSIPDTLKSWIDQITRAGRTFKYGESGPMGLIRGKKVFLAFASGGIYSVEPMKSLDFAEPYLRNILGFLGMTDVTTFRMEGVKIPGIAEHAFEKALGEIEKYEFA